MVELLCSKKGVQKRFNSNAMLLHLECIQVLSTSISVQLAAAIVRGAIKSGVDGMQAYVAYTETCTTYLRICHILASRFALIGMVRQVLRTVGITCILLVTSTCAYVAYVAWSQSVSQSQV